MSKTVRHGLSIVPVPHFWVQPLPAALVPFTASINLNPSALTVMVHVAETVAPLESTTVMVGVAFACGLTQVISPRPVSIDMPAGAFVSENV